MLHRCCSGGRSTNPKCNQVSSLLLYPRFVLLSLQLCGTDHFVPYYTFRVRCYYGAPPTLFLSCYKYFSSLKLKEHIHTTSIYTELCFICYKISPLVFFLCRYCLLYTSHERLMILNLACFKAFCSSVDRAVSRAVVDVMRSTTTARAAPDHQPAYTASKALFLP